MKLSELTREVRRLGSATKYDSRPRTVERWPGMYVKHDGTFVPALRVRAQDGTCTPAVRQIPDGTIICPYGCGIHYHAVSDTCVIGHRLPHCCDKNRGPHNDGYYIIRPDAVPLTLGRKAV
jgi:hypothetical protein